MTLTEIRDEINVHKPCSEAQTKRYIRAVGIEPIGARQRPQVYPQDAGKRILAHLGYADSPAPAAAPADGGLPAPAKPRQVKLNGKVLPQTKPELKSGRVVSLNKLKSVREQSRKAVAK